MKSLAASIAVALACAPAAAAASQTPQRGDGRVPAAKSSRTTVWMLAPAYGLAKLERPRPSAFELFESDFHRFRWHGWGRHRARGHGIMKASFVPDGVRATVTLSHIRPCAKYDSRPVYGRITVRWRRANGELLKGSQNVDAFC